MTSSSEPRAGLASATASVTPLRTPELRHGAWTRLGDKRVLGDAPSETVFDQLAERAWVAARSQGYAVGYSDGRRKAAATAAGVARELAAERAAADEQRQQEHAAAMSALRAAAEHLRELVSATCAGIEEQATGLALALTEELVGHELRTDAPADVVRRVLQVLPGGGVNVLVRLHPTTLGSAASGELSGEGVRLMADSTLGVHDAVVELADRVLRLDVGGALERVREVLR